MEKKLTTKQKVNQPNRDVICKQELQQGDSVQNFFLKNFFKDFIYLFLETGEGREKERERNINVGLSLMLPLLGTWPTTQECALTADPLVCRLVLNPLSHTNQG